jgi:histidinol-phosphate aminotransferase
LRVGWCYAPRRIIEILERVRGPFNVNAAALAAGTAAIADHDHVRKAVEHNEKWLGDLTGSFEKMGLRVTPSVGNFLLLHFPETPGKTAADADAYLTQKGLILRAVSGYGFPNALRMTIGTDEANRAVVDALKTFMADDRKA